MELSLDQALKKGVEAHKAGKLEEADRYYTAILKAQTKHPDANHNMGVLAVGFGKVQEALPFFKTALEANPSIVQFWLSYIEALIKLNRVADAKVVLEEAKSKGVKAGGFEQIEKRLISFDSKNTDVQDPPQDQLNSLINLYNQKKLQQVFYETQILTKQYTKSLVLWNLMGASAAQIGRLDEAALAFQNTINIKPDSAEAYNNMGNALKGQGKLDEAIEAYNKTLSLNPNSAQACYNMGVAHYEKGKLDEAIEAYNKSILLKPDFAEAYNNMGLVFKEQGKLNEAIEAYNKTISLKPDFAEAYNNMGFALRAQGKLNETIEAYNNAISIKPNYPIPYYGLASIQYERGDLTSVMENLERVNLNISELDSDKHILTLPYKILTSLKYNEIENVKDFNKSEVFKNPNKFPLIIERNVEDKLIDCLYKLSTRSLDETKDARYGTGKCSTDFKLFEIEEPIIEKVAAELLQSMENLLDGTILYHESFFNILGAGGGSEPHDHLEIEDLNFDLAKYKFSLVYYLSVGDQNCTEPGTLKLYEPNIDILPTKGMCVLIPGSRKHSAIYNGSKDRMMIGCNFYLV